MLYSVTCHISAYVFYAHLNGLNLDVWLYTNVLTTTTIIIMNIIANNIIIIINAGVIWEAIHAHCAIPGSHSVMKLCSNYIQVRGRTDRVQHTVSQERMQKGTLDEDGAYRQQRYPANGNTDILKQPRNAITRLYIKQHLFRYTEQQHIIH